MAALWFQLLEGAVRSLFHDNPGIYFYHSFFFHIKKRDLKLIFKYYFILRYNHKIYKCFTVFFGSNIVI